MYSRWAVIGSLLSRSRTRSGEMASIFRSRQDVQQPIQEADAGVKLEGGGEQGTGVPQGPNRGPPAYAPH